jgi:hypothetical protein
MFYVWNTTLVVWTVSYKTAVIEDFKMQTVTLPRNGSTATEQ